MLNFRDYLCVIQKNTKKNKNTLLINQRKKKNLKKIRQKIHHIYLLIVLRERNLYF
jgi:hypothetical protein